MKAGKLSYNADGISHDVIDDTLTIQITGVNIVQQSFHQMHG